MEEVTNGAGIKILVMDKILGVMRFSVREARGRMSVRAREAIWATEEVITEEISGYMDKGLNVWTA